MLVSCNGSGSGSGSRHGQPSSPVEALSVSVYAQFSTAWTEGMYHHYQLGSPRWAFLCRPSAKCLNARPQPRSSICNQLTVRPRGGRILALLG